MFINSKNNQLVFTMSHHHLKNCHVPPETTAVSFSPITLQQDSWYELYMQREYSIMLANVTLIYRTEDFYYYNVIYNNIYIYNIILYHIRHNVILLKQSH